MKVAIITLASRIGEKTGDVLQAKKTHQALLDMGITVSHLILELPNILLNYSTNESISADSLNKDYDILHFIPPLPSAFLKYIKPNLKPRLVASTIFWRSAKTTFVEFKTSKKIKIKPIINIVLAFLGVRSILSYHLYDMLLPNSQAEMRSIQKYCLLKKSALMFSIPNSIDVIKKWVFEVPRYDFLPKTDYILYAGIFAPRKNQLTFIKAMKDISLPIVFIGGSFKNGSYLSRCKKEATSTMTFLGYVEHGTKEFYSCLLYARIACLASACETPGLALLEAAALGARPVVTTEGGTYEYYRSDAVYLNPLSKKSIRNAILEGWHRGRLNDNEQLRYRQMTWDNTASSTSFAYSKLLSSR